MSKIWILPIQHYVGNQCYKFKYQMAHWPRFGISHGGYMMDILQYVAIINLPCLTFISLRPFDVVHQVNFVKWNYLSRSRMHRLVLRIMSVAGSENRGTEVLCAFVIYLISTHHKWHSFAKVDTPLDIYQTMPLFKHWFSVNASQSCNQILFFSIQLHVLVSNRIPNEYILIAFLGIGIVLVDPSPGVMTNMHAAHYMYGGLGSWWIGYHQDCRTE